MNVHYVTQEVKQGISIKTNELHINIAP